MTDDPNNAAPASALAQQIAGQIMTSFALYRADFTQSTLAARGYFHDRDWHGIQALGARRLAAYTEHLNPLVERVRTVIGAASLSAAELATLWRSVKAQYTQALAARYDREMGETFYNSAYRRLRTHSQLANDETFVQPAVLPEVEQPAQPLLRRFEPGEEGLVHMMQQLLGSLPLTLPWQDFDRDIRNILRSLPEARPELESSFGLAIEIVDAVFYRNKGAYVVGRVCQGDNTWPLALPLLQDASGRLYVDTLICDEDELSIMFSFTRAYFLVDVPEPTALVDFLWSLLPNKKRSELYSAIGLHKHGKTVFYRGFVEHLAQSSDPFIIAPGIKGMVMAVFSLPSYQVVFKIIKDQFAPQKNITAAQVKEKYAIVKEHDRVGRMADTQEYHNFVLPLARFDAALLTELRSVASDTVRVVGDDVIISHLYIERQMTPLNLYIEDADERALRSALDEYGNAIKQLAAANIFPGDMLLKNFGVTRHGRVVFYDYDEITYLTEVNFRTIPEPKTPEQEMASEPWYAVAPNDVFPEEFRKFLFGRRKIKAQFAAMHGELFDAEYWKTLQADIRAGTIRDVFPYRRKRRFLANVETS